MSERQPIMFLSGPYRGRCFRETEANVEAAAKWVALPKRRGWAVICPHTNSHLPSLLCEFGSNDESWIKDSLTLLSKCDGILMLPHWQESEGAKAEHHCAEARKMLIYYWQYADNAPERGGIPTADEFWEAQRAAACCEPKPKNDQQATLPLLNDPQSLGSVQGSQEENQPSGNSGELTCTQAGSERTHNGIESSQVGQSLGGLCPEDKLNIINPTYK